MQYVKKNASFSTSSRCARIYTIKLVAWANGIYCNQYVIPIYLKHMKNEKERRRRNDCICGQSPTTKTTTTTTETTFQQQNKKKKNIERITISRIREFWFSQRKNLKWDGVSEASMQCSASKRRWMFRRETSLIFEHDQHC